MTDVRRKGSRLELQVVHLLQDLGIPAEKISRTGHAGPDLRIADQWTAEVKGRKDGAGFKQIVEWLGTADVLFLRQDRHGFLVVLPWDHYITLLRSSGQDT